MSQGRWKRRLLNTADWLRSNVLHLREVPSLHLVWPLSVSTWPVCNWESLLIRSLPPPPSLSLSSLFSTALLKPPVDYDLLSHVLKLYRRLVNVSLVCHQKSISPPTRLLKSCSMSSVVFLSKTWLFDLTASRHSLWQKPYSTSMPFSHLCTINFMNVR